AERPELGRRQITYRGDRPQIAMADRTVVVVDDGAATGTTMKAVLVALRRRSPRQVIVALPVAPPATVRDLATEADRVVCLHVPQAFVALGQYYRQFPQLTDEEVVRILDQAAADMLRDNPDGTTGRA